jgi:hypothetical protein
MSEDKELRKTVERFEGGCPMSRPDPALSRASQQYVGFEEKA